MFYAGYKDGKEKEFAILAELTCSKIITDGEDLLGQVKEGSQITLASYWCEPAKTWESSVDDGSRVPEKLWYLIIGASNHFGLGGVFDGDSLDLFGLILSSTDAQEQTFYRVGIFSFTRSRIPKATPTSLDGTYDPTIDISKLVATLGEKVEVTII